MSEQATPQPSGKISILGIALPACLIFNFIYRAFVPAHEYAMRSEQVLTMVIDFALVASLIAIRRKIPPVLFWAALAAGIGIWFIRLLGGDASWWTGHWSYSLLPRR